MAAESYHYVWDRFAAQIWKRAREAGVRSSALYLLENS